MKAHLKTLGVFALILGVITCLWYFPGETFFTIFGSFILLMSYSIVYELVNETRGDD